MFKQITKYWPEKGKSGFIVWRYLLKRDDPIPAPWTKDGKKRIERLGLTLQVFVSIVAPPFLCDMLVRKYFILRSDWLELSNPVCGFITRICIEIKLWTIDHFTSLLQSCYLETVKHRFCTIECVTLSIQKDGRKKTTPKNLRPFTSVIK